MSSLRTNFSVGLFVILGMASVIAFVLWLGMSQYFKEGRHYVAFFDESVQGLKKDSAVKYRGVMIGRVESIGVAQDGQLIRILFNLDNPLQDQDQMIARIKSIGITGIMFIELERMQKKDLLLSPKISFETQYPIIATRPSDMKQLLTDIYDILNTIQQIDIKGISDRIVATLDNANQMMKDAEVKKVSKDIQITLEHTRKIIDTQKWAQITDNLHQASQKLPGLLENMGSTVTRIDEALKNHNQKIATTLDQLHHAAENTTGLMDNGNALIRDAHETVYQIDRQISATLSALESAVNSMNQLIRQLMDQPSALLFSTPPAPKPVESEYP